MADSLQAITASISTTGIEYFAKEVVATRLAAALSGLQPPGRRISVPDFGNGYDNYSNIQIVLSNGQFLKGPAPIQPLAPVYQGIAQAEDGEFTVTLKATDVAVAYDWTETYDYRWCTVVTYGGTNCHGPVAQEGQYDYCFAAGEIDFAVSLRLVFEGSRWSLSLVSSSATVLRPIASIPSKSVLHHQGGIACFDQHVSALTKQAIEKIDFQSALDQVLQQVLFSVPASGHLTPKIVFDFGTGPAGLTFPGNQGVAVGATGQVTFEGTPYSGTHPPTLAVPAVPSGHHLALEVADYELDALFWAFYNDRLLVQTVKPGDLPDPAPLNTDSYRNTPLQALYQDYPNSAMTAYVKAIQAPTVSFQAVYDLTPSALSALQKELPSEVYEKVTNLRGLVFLEATAFTGVLQGAIGEAAAKQYGAVIQNQAKQQGAAVHHQIQVVLNVLQNGKAIRVLTFNANQTDVLQNLALGLAPSKTAQTLQFDFATVPSATTTRLISSTIGITTQDFGYIWNFVLAPEYANEARKMGQNGVPLPCMTGFDYVFDQAVVGLEDGYVSILADVKASAGD